MRVEKEDKFIDGFGAGLLVATVIIIVVSMLTSCASYPNQSKVIKADKTKTATFR